DDDTLDRRLDLELVARFRREGCQRQADPLALGLLGILGGGCLLGRRHADLHLERALLALAPDRELGLRAPRIRHVAGEVARVLDRLAVEPGDDVADTQIAARGRRLGLDAVDEHAFRARAPHRLSQLLGQWLHLDAEPAALHAAVLAQLVDHLHHGCRWNGEADADAAAVGRVDRGVDPDHLARLVEERPAGVTWIDRRIDLDVVVIGTRADVAAPRGDDPGGCGAAEAVGIADRHDPVAHAGLLRIPELDIRQRLARIDLEHG